MLRPDGTATVIRIRPGFTPMVSRMPIGSPAKDDSGTDGASAPAVTPEEDSQVRVLKLAS